MRKCRSVNKITFLVLGFAIAVFASRSASAQTGAPYRVTEIPSPAGAGSAEPNVVVAPDGTVYLSWIEPMAPRGHALKLSTLGSDGNWTAPRTIATGDNWFVNWADFPSVFAMPNGTLAAHWLAKSGPGTYAYNVNIALSKDSGRTWSKPIVPHRDGTQTEHGFVSMYPMPDGQLGAIWLDGRKMNPAGKKDGDHAQHTNSMSLMSTTIRPDGTLGSESLVDGRVCECCQTSAARTDEGLIAVYRDRSEKEIRDIAVVRNVNGKWTDPAPLSKDGWEINGCPVNGPAVAADGSRVVVSWFTAVNDKPAVYAVFSADSGKTFGRPVRVDDGNPLGRVDALLYRGKGSDALVSWVEQAPTGAQVRVKRVSPSGASEGITVSGTSAARSSGFPRMDRRMNNDVIIAWTDPVAVKDGKVRTAIMRASSAAPKSDVR